MLRRGFLLGAAGIAVAGCARVQPTLVTESPVAPTQAVGPLRIGSDRTPAGVMLAQLLAEALLAGSRAASVADVGDDWQASLADGSLAATPAYAATIWAQLSSAEDPPAPESMLTEVAGLVAPEVSTLAATGVDGGLVWLVTERTAKAGITSLDRIAGWSKGKVAAIPALAAARADGVPGIRGLYHGAFRLARLEDPAQRAAQLVGGQVALAAFRRTDYTGATHLVALEDPDVLGVADPLVVLLDAAMAEADPEAVLAMHGVTEILTTRMLIDLQARVAAGAVARDVARQWLVVNGLA